MLINPLSGCVALHLPFSLKPPPNCLQLRATLTQRESAYLTLLETVQQLFLEHSPGGSGGGSSPAKAVTAQAGTCEHRS